MPPWRFTRLSAASKGAVVHLHQMITIIRLRQKYTSHVWNRLHHDQLDAWDGFCFEGLSTIGYMFIVTAQPLAGGSCICAAQIWALARPRLPHISASFCQLQRSSSRCHPSHVDASAAGVHSYVLTMPVSQSVTPNAHERSHGHASPKSTRYRRLRQRATRTYARTGPNSGRPAPDRSGARCRR